MFDDDAELALESETPVEASAEIEAANVYDINQDDATGKASQDEDDPHHDTPTSDAQCQRYI